MRARDVTRRPAVTVRSDTTLQQVARIMDEAAVGSVVVVEGTHPVGIATDRDLVTRGMARACPLDARIDSVMTPGVVCVDADTDLHDVVQLFGRHPFRRLPVVDRDQVIGVITTDDLLMDLTSDLEKIARAVTVQTLFGHPESQPPART
jgi:CBS domain-containing protein